MTIDLLSRRINVRRCIWLNLLRGSTSAMAALRKEANEEDMEVQPSGTNDMRTLKPTSIGKTGVESMLEDPPLWVKLHNDRDRLPVKIALGWRRLKVALLHRDRSRAWRGLMTENLVGRN